jgi:hypothetical protein
LSGFAWPKEGDVKGFSHGFVTFARAKPMNAAFVAEAPLQRFSTAICCKRLKTRINC